MNMTSLTLLWLAGYSNVTSIVVIILCFLAMTIFIGFVSTNWDYSERRNTTAGVEERNMVQVCNPFFIELGQTGRKLTDGISVHLSSLCPSKLFVLWGVKINPLHDFILKPGLHVRDALEDGHTEDYKELGALHYDTLQFPEPGDHEVKLPCPVTIDSDTLGTMPRKRYPVTIFSLSSESCDATSHASEKLNGCVDKQSIIGLISVIHLQDEIVVQPSHIIGQYVKTSGVQLYSLQPLFLSSAIDGCHGNQNETLNRKNKRDETVTRLGSPPDETVTLLGSPAEKDRSSSNNPHEDLNPADVAPKLGDTADSTDNGPSQKNFLQYSSLLDEAEPAIRRRNANSSSESVLTSANTRDISELSPCGNREENPPLGCEGGKVTQPECVVCQTRPVMCALLPCRHACVCLGCFKLLDRCPMCRGILESYFVLGGEDAQEVEEESTLHDLQHQAVNEHFTQVWERLNHRLNAFFGIR
ncbi:unnamed protein product [Lymnaea stagnalis]|uniref:RING-type domain-containing protein n=1 Tax=Lymnaea stagnalis TaxID=6523 RepID=A0AAV2I0F5_LYMST